MKMPKMICTSTGDILIGTLNETEKLKEINKELLEALEGIIELIDNGVLVRDISEDDSKSYYLKQGLEIVSKLSKAKQAITKATK